MALVLNETQDILQRITQEDTDLMGTAAFQTKPLGETLEQVGEFLLFIAEA